MSNKLHAGYTRSRTVRTSLAIILASGLLVFIYDRNPGPIWELGKSLEFSRRDANALPSAPSAQEVKQGRNSDREIPGAFVSPVPDPTSVRDETALGHAGGRPVDSDKLISTGFSFERSLESDAGMTMEDAESLITKQDLPRLIDRFAAESGADRDAEMLSRIFRSVIDRSIIKARSRVRLTGFACGAQVCVGTMEDGNIFDYIMWRDEFALAPELSGANVTAATMPEANGSMIMRFLFFVDPAREPGAPDS